MRTKWRRVKKTEIANAVVPAGRKQPLIAAVAHLQRSFGLVPYAFPLPKYS